MNDYAWPSASPEDGPALAPVSSTTLREQVTQAVRSALMMGHFKPGQTVTVKSLCSLLHASVMPTREAVNRLIAEGALELRANRTVAVPAVSLQEFNELTQLRCLIEGLAGAQAVQAFRPAHTQALLALERQMADAVACQDIDAYLDANARFHFTIYALGTTAYTRSIIEKLWVRVGPLIRYCLTESGLETSSNLHQTMIDGLARRDPQALRQAIESDILGAAQTIRRSHDLWPSGA